MYVWARQVALVAYKSDCLRNVNICVTFVFVYLYLHFWYTAVCLYLCYVCICVFGFLIYLWARQVALDACLQNRPSCKSEDVSETRIFWKQSNRIRKLLFDDCSKCQSYSFISLSVSAMVFGSATPFLVSTFRLDSIQQSVGRCYYNTFDNRVMIVRMVMIMMIVMTIVIYHLIQLVF